MPNLKAASAAEAGGGILPFNECNAPKPGKKEN
jgi:hypothetical protein